MTEPPGRTADSLHNDEGDSDDALQADGNNNIDTTPPSPTRTVSIVPSNRSSRREASERLPPKSGFRAKEILPSETDTNAVDTPDYKDQVRFGPSTYARVQHVNENTFDRRHYKDQVQSTAASAIRGEHGDQEVNTHSSSPKLRNNPRVISVRPNHRAASDSSSSSFVQHTDEAQISTIQAEVVDSDLEAARLRHQILLELQDQAPIAAEIELDSPTVLRHRRRCIWILAFVVVVAIVTGVVVAVSSNNNNNTDTGNPSSNNTSMSPLVAPSVPPSLSPTMAFWSPRGDVVRGRSTGHRIGDSVALSANGRILATGGQSTAFQEGGDDIGRIRVFELQSSSESDTNATWVQLGQDIEGGFGKDLGRIVCLSSDGQIVASGERFGGDAIQGRVLVHRFNTGSQQWELLGQELFGNITNGIQPWFGFSVSLSGDGYTLAVGAPIDNVAGLNAGRLWVFRYNADALAWLQLGSDIFPTQDIGQLGISVALSRDGLRLAGGGYFTQPQFTYEAGRVTAYQFQDGDWKQLGQNLDGESEDDYLGWAVAMTANGTRLACSDVMYDHDIFGENAGRVRVFELIDSVWEQVGEPLFGSGEGDGFGSSIALSDDGTTLVVGATDLGGGTTPGYVRVFGFDGSGWVQLGPDLEGDNPGDRFGTWVATSADGSVVAGGSPFNDAIGMDSGLVRVYDRELL